ncbi:putative glycoside hydrolase [uncultured Roseivirga sp.]|uniref:putative glycoside hydrolase n=1 Tax=uncultured Roseivirga sp. TaxID=543088 RepID=UPI0030DA8BBB|tara:strand:- start:156994 stop:158085 length:1092 start_codon:yes stop_codon:yes gene_type:complete
MKKRDFIKNIGLGSAAFMLAPALLTSCGTTTSTDEDFKYWVWVDGNNEKTIADWKTELTGLREVGITGLIIGGGRQMLEKLIPIAQELGQEVHAWLWTMNRPGDTEAQAHPEWYAVSRNGESSLEVNPYVGYYQWLCPSKPEVQEYVKNFMVSHCDIEGLSAIHLDYVRYCDVILPKGLWAKYDLVQDHEMPEYDFCYCETCQGNFEAENGYRPDSLEDPSQDEKWRKYRWDSITKLVNQVSAAVHAKGKKMSAAVFPYPELARKLVRQSWNEWDLDIVFPMIYHNFYEEDIPWIEYATQRGVNDLNGKFPLHTGVYLPEMKPEEISQAIAAAKAGGAKGMSFFSNGALKDERLKAFAAVKKS